MTRPRLLFYCQHSLGLGHLARSLTLAGGLAAWFDVVLLNGGRLPAGTRVPGGVRLVDLPPLGHDPDDYRLVSHDPRFTVEQAQSTRRRLVLEAYGDVDPAVVLVELFPFGRKKFAFELEPLLERAHAAASGRPLVLCSLRDLLVTNRSNQAHHDERAARTANAWFDAILVHADPRFARLEETFAPATPLRVPVHYTGFVAPLVPAAGSGHDRDANRRRRVLVSAGGGMVGGALFAAAAAAHRRIVDRCGLTTTIVAGPFLPRTDWRWLDQQARQAAGLEVVRRVDDLSAEMRRSAVSVSQCGYNTTMDLLRAGVPAVVVPFSEGKEDEQRQRAERLARLRAVRVLPPGALTADGLTDAVAAATAFRPAALDLDLDGRAESARIVATMAGLS